MDEKVLLIDDDPSLLTILQLVLQRRGFAVETASSGEEGLRRAYSTHPDIVILDVLMPGLDGWSTCQRLRQLCDRPIIMLTAMAETEYIVKGLNGGADDYLTKPFSFDELVARMRTVLRRVHSARSQEWRHVFDDGHLSIDFGERAVMLDHQPIPLTPTELDLLIQLASQKGRVVPHKELLTHVWGPECAENIGYLSVYIRYLRKKIEKDPSNPHYIRTRCRIGYYFAGYGETQSQAPAEPSDQVIGAQRTHTPVDRAMDPSFAPEWGYADRTARTREEQPVSTY
jgi:DNA-binding response OmpR family regulator